MCILDEIGFTPEQYKTLKARMTDVEIVEEQLYCSPQALRAWKAKHGLAPKKYNKKAKKFTYAEWEEKKKQGMKEKEIMKAFGYRTLKHYVEYKKKIGVPYLKKKIERTPELLAEIKGYLDQGMTINELTPKLSVKMTETTAGTIIKEEKLREGNVS
ncbi:hypothetical protein [Bacillus swezeyi]|uniref:Uncharacterized protein n=1 Tax=Bacillus swezeyi TaxID=1925020 RepID=A0A5M8RVW8_9BACI|nr:hypothetical protein [Bacillus swezeyi]KAA6450974.1 hypothetical protein DX927_09085 [Bacillus swezeyi]